MSYHVHRSHLVFDEGVHICLADAIDHRSPGELVETEPEEGEYDTATEAAEAALALSNRTGEPVALSCNDMVYSSAEDPTAAGDLGAWAHRRDEAAAEAEAWEADREEEWA